MTSVRYRHFTLEQYEAKIVARFWAKVHKSESCWLWQGSLNSKGYGVYSMTEYSSSRIVQDVKRHKFGAHRYSWALANGPIPDGMDIDHICHNPTCVRPNHLRSTTRKQNLENRIGPNSNSTSGVRGVHWDRSKQRWVAKVGHNGKSYRAGQFKTLEEAEAAVIAKRNELHTHNTWDRLA